MPRYFFHLTFGRRTVPDEEGVELPNRTAAREEALAVVRDLANPELRGNPRRWASWFLEVEDATGGFFRTPIGHPALEVVSPQTNAHRSQPLWPAPVAPLPDSGAGARTAEIVREMAARRQVTVQLLKHNEQLRRELTSICLASEAIRIRANRLVSRFHAARTRFEWFCNAGGAPRLAGAPAAPMETFSRGVVNSDKVDENPVGRDLRPAWPLNASPF